MCLPSIHEAWVQSPPLPCQISFPLLSNSDAAGPRSETGSISSSRCYTAALLCASGPHTVYHAAVVWLCVNDLRKELSFQRLIFFLHKSEHSVPDFKQQNIL